MISPDSTSHWREQGYRAIAGVDEVGRGPLAGPVVAAAVILPEGFNEVGLADSKRMAAQTRALVAEAVHRHALVGIGFVPAPQIDRLNIHHATLLAMRRAVQALPQLPDFALFDGLFVPSGLSCPGEAIIAGDARVDAIAAASIIAKVARDRMMSEAEGRFPGYGFAGHSGYPTPFHKAALQRLGLSPLHRRSFGPCRALAES